LALVQRSATASTQPRKGQTPSQATISKLKKAMSDPSQTKYGETLGGRAGGCIAPDGGACADYYKGWRYLPSTYSLFTPAQGYASGQIEMRLTEEQTLMLRNHSRVKEALERLSNLSGVPSTKQYKRDAGAPASHAQSVAKYQKVVDEHLFSEVIAPQLKADQELKRKYEEDQKQTIATLKMRVLELEKPIYEPITKITTERSWSKYAILGIGVVIFLIILRRRA